MPKCVGESMQNISIQQQFHIPITKGGTPDRAAWAMALVMGKTN
jgi:hypothetical protein